jgi:pimeloyl-ACP methyl ester carboxylesterase
MIVLAAVVAAVLGSLGPSPAASPHLLAAHACQGAPDFECVTLRVPLDWRGKVKGQLGLQVAMGRNTDAPRGVLIELTGGPGQPGVPFAERAAQRFGTIASQYRLVLIDQRGTGGRALRCPALQSIMGSSDLTVPPAGVVAACAARLGPRRRFFSTWDTIHDLDALRSALGVGKLTLDGISYGSYVAERYALAYPTHVARLVLDSVVPHDGADPFYLAGLTAAARVLRSVCSEQGGCPSDPATDLAAVVAARHDGPQLLDTLVALSVEDPTFKGVPEALREAHDGQTAKLDQIVAQVHANQAATADLLSQGLHAATLCADSPVPWGGPDAPLAGRKASLERAAARLTHDDVWPFDAATAMGNGFVQTCLHWPRTPEPPLPRSGRMLPPVPVLLLAGDHDLSTPLAWARREAALAPRGQLVVVHDAGHSVQSRAGSDAGRQAVTQFLLS